MALVAAIGVHDIDLRYPVALRGKCDLPTAAATGQW
jgi:hypothetical protein